jgi:hypothetical protein
MQTKSVTPSNVESRSLLSDGRVVSYDDRAGQAELERIIVALDLLRLGETSYRNESRLRYQASTEVA